MILVSSLSQPLPAAFLGSLQQFWPYFFLVCFHTVEKGIMVPSIENPSSTIALYLCALQTCHLGPCIEFLKFFCGVDAQQIKPGFARVLKRSCFLGFPWDVMLVISPENQSLSFQAIMYMCRNFYLKVYYAPLLSTKPMSLLSEE